MNETPSGKIGAVHQSGTVLSVMRTHKARSTARKRRVAEAKGRWAERLAVLILQLKLYTICERRWKSRRGEIDIIARRGRVIVFVEVKFRHDLTNAQLAVTPAAVRRLTQTAGIYLQLHHNKLPQDFEVRFDVISIAPLALHHERDAFRPF